MFDGSNKNSPEEEFIRKARNGEYIDPRAYGQYVEDKMKSDDECISIVIPSGTSFYGYDQEGPLTISVTGTNNPPDSKTFTLEATSRIIKPKE